MKKLAVVLMVLCLVYPAYSAQKQSQTDTKKKIQQYNAIAKKKSQQSKNLLSQLSRLKKDASASQAEMANLEQENRKLQDTVGEINRNIDSVNASMNEILALLRGRLVDLYKKTSEEVSLSLILNSNSTHDAVNTAYMIQRFAREDQAMIDELAQKEHELTEARAKLKENQDQIAAKTTELKKKRDEFDTTIKKTDTLLKNVQSEQRKAEAAAKELESAQRAVGAKITNLMKQKTTKTAKSSKTTVMKNSGSGSAIKITQTKGSSQPKSAPAQTAAKTPAASPKSLAWPVRGTVTMQYGSRIHPTFKTKIFNSGIDIKAASGTPVKAAAPGEVLYQGWLRGFGQVVIIDHGGDLSTVYAHLAGANVREGASVKAGTIIGRVGNSGTDSDYGLHFEVRKNGAAQNPMNYLHG